MIARQKMDGRGQIRGRETEVREVIAVIPKRGQKLDFTSLNFPLAYL